jgi:hypothetical protein
MTRKVKIVTPMGVNGCLSICRNKPTWDVSVVLDSGIEERWQTCTRDLVYTLPRNGDFATVKWIPDKNPTAS